MPSPHQLLIMKAATETPATRDWLSRASAPGVMHVFERAVNLVDDDAGVLSLVSHPLGAGPFTIVLGPDWPGDELHPRFDRWLDAGSQVDVQPGRLNAGRLSVMFGAGEIWDPTLPWEMLRRQRPTVLRSRAELTELLRKGAPPGGLSPLLTSDVTHSAMPDALSEAVLAQAREPAALLAHALAAGDVGQAESAAAQLAGLGGGLTPSGDDFIVGAMYGVWLHRESFRAGETSRRLADAAGPRTARISQAWLDAAARGAASLAWHRLFDAILGDDRQRLADSTRDLLAVGHTSGADALTGFLMTLEAMQHGLDSEAGAGRMS
jgi:hypothetical protein